MLSIFWKIVAIEYSWIENIVVELKIVAIEKKLYEDKDLEKCKNLIYGKLKANVTI